MVSTSTMKYLALLLTAALFSACHEQSEPSASAPPTTPAAASLRGRLDAAEAIVGVTARDDALSKLATDAARVNDLDVTTEAIGHIIGITSKDSAAAACALELAKQAQPKAASQVAQMIISTQLRDQTLTAIAKGN